MPGFKQDATALLIGASGGIGFAVTEQLLRDARFSRVIATSRNPAGSSRLADLEAANDKLECVSLDATDPESLDRLAEHLKSTACRPSLLMYCAGLLHDGPSVKPEKRLEDIELDALQQVFAVNTFGPALMLKALLPLMDREQRSVVAAVSARVGSIEDNRLGGWYAYRASKSALNQLIKTASIEARRRFKNCILISLHPGTTDTALSRPFQANVPEGKLFSSEFVADRFMTIIDGLEADDSGNFVAWDGERIPW